jgi:hypothetical protein
MGAPGIIILLAVAAVSIYVCYRCIRDGKVGPQFGLKWPTDEAPKNPSAPDTSCNCLINGYYISVVTLLGSAVTAVFTGEKWLPLWVLLMIAASFALGMIQQRMSRRCPEIARRIF